MPHSSATGDGCVAIRVGVCAGQLIAILFQDESWRAAAAVCLNGGAPASAEVKQKIKVTSENVYHTDVNLSIQFLP
jgi:dienelactone hydrolase